MFIQSVCLYKVIIFMLKWCAGCFIVCSGISLAQSSSSTVLQKESAGILESLKVNIYTISDCYYNVYMHV